MVKLYNGVPRALVLRGTVRNYTGMSNGLGVRTKRGRREGDSIKSDVIELTIGENKINKKYRLTLI